MGIERSPKPRILIVYTLPADPYVVSYLVERWLRFRLPFCIVWYAFIFFPPPHVLGESVEREL